MVLVMIKIERTAAPDILFPVPDPSQKMYTHMEVRRSLSAMQHGKCCYCEKVVDSPDKFSDDDNLVNGSNVEKHVEHFRPKGKKEFKHLTNDWKNLLLACNTCNVNKGQKFEVNQYGNPLCIDPSNPDINPEDHIMLREIDLKNEPDFDVGRLIPRNDSVFGKWTIKNVGLNEGTSRKDRWKKIHEILKDILDYKMVSRDDKLRSYQLQILRAKRLPEAEYAFVARELYRQYNIPE